jgi:hypothetical protein
MEVHGSREGGSRIHALCAGGPRVPRLWSSLGIHRSVLAPKGSRFAPKAGVLEPGRMFSSWSCRTSRSNGERPNVSA